MLSADEPPAELGGAHWVQIPEDASSVVVREYIGDRDAEQLATLDIETAGRRPASTALTDDALADQFTAMAWTLMKLATLHRTIKPELLDQPNVLLTAQAADLGAADTTPGQPLHDRHFPARAADEALLLDIRAARHPVLERHAGEHLARVHRAPAPAQLGHQQGRRSPTPTAQVRIAIAAKDFGAGHWLDTGGRHRGFVVLRWLDNPDPPEVTDRRAIRSAR